MYVRMWGGVGGNRIMAQDDNTFLGFNVSNVTKYKAYRKIAAIHKFEVS